MFVPAGLGSLDFQCLSGHVVILDSPPQFYSQLALLLNTCWELGKETEKNCPTSEESVVMKKPGLGEEAFIPLLQEFFMKKIVKTQKPEEKWI